MTPAAMLTRKCRDCGAELESRRRWLCAACIRRRIERGGAR